MTVLRWFGFVALLLPAAAGAFFALLFVGFSFMAGDSPQSNGKAWPYLVIVGAIVVALGAGFLVLNGVSLMIAGRTKASLASLAAPATLAAVFVSWIAVQ